MKHTAEPYSSEGKYVTLNGENFATALSRADACRSGDARRMADCLNALEGIPDPAAALTAAREAIEALVSNPGVLEAAARASITKQQVKNAEAALAGLKGEQP